MGKGCLRKLGCGTLTLPMLWDLGGGCSLPRPLNPPSLVLFRSSACPGVQDRRLSQVGPADLELSARNRIRVS